MKGVVSNHTITGIDSFGTNDFINIHVFICTLFSTPYNKEKHKANVKCLVSLNPRQKVDMVLIIFQQNEI